MSGIFLSGFENKVALVCGAGGGGVGIATTRLLVGAGARIVAVDRTRELLDEVRQVVDGAGAECFEIVADLRDPAQVAEVVPTVAREFGRLDQVVNIAGGMQAGQWMPIRRTPEETFREIFALNFDYVVAVCRAAGSLMMESGGGAIVNISSVSGLRSAPFHASYGAAKRAVVSYTESIAAEWGRYNIRANCVTPGSVLTKRHIDAGRTDQIRAFSKTFPIQRPVEPVDIAGAAMFLLSDMAKAITGQNLVVDCGQSVLTLTGTLDEWIDACGEP